MNRFSKKDWDYIQTRKGGDVYNKSYAQAVNKGYSKQQAISFASSVIKTKTKTGNKLYKPTKRRRQGIYGMNLPRGGIWG